MRQQRIPCARKSPAHQALGRATRELRARRSISQEELGFRSGLHRNYVGSIERGEINPTFRILLKLSKGLDVPLSEFVRIWERQLQDRPTRNIPLIPTAADGRHETHAC